METFSYSDYNKENQSPHLIDFTNPYLNDSLNSGINNNEEKNKQDNSIDKDIIDILSKKNKEEN
jgi:hypothetical protein